MMGPGANADVRRPGEGMRRAAARLKAHRAKWDDVPSADRESRQRVRAEQRADLKKQRARLKQDAMANKLPGGSAVIR